MTDPQDPINLVLDALEPSSQGAFVLRPDAGRRLRAAFAECAETPRANEDAERLLRFIVFLGTNRRSPETAASLLEAFEPLIPALALGSTVLRSELAASARAFSRFTASRPTKESSPANGPTEAAVAAFTLVATARRHLR